MKRIFLLLACNLVLLSLSQAQLKYGIGGGIHNSSVLEKNNLPGWSQNVKPYFSEHTGFHAGAYAEYLLGKKSNWSVMASLSYVNKGRNYSWSNDSTKNFTQDTSTILSKWRLNYVQLPLHIVYRIPVTSNIRFIVGAGGYAGLYLNGKTSYDIYNGSGEVSSYENKLATGDDVNAYNKFNYGISALAGLDFNNRVMLTANYTRGLSDFYRATYGGSFKHETLGASLVIWLNKNKVKKTTKKVVEENVDKDTDGDGIPDKDDLCIDKPGGASTKGCPDADGDGIADHLDKCPDKAGVAALDGCPKPDKDGDGIPDDEDKCPETAGSKELGGCPEPADMDGDGVPDTEDKCPAKAGPKTNNGCPVADTFDEDFRKAAKGIRFDVNSDNINESSFESLNIVSKLLIENPEMKLDIEGHTDNTGSVRTNQVLSGRRALAIKTYLVNKGVKADRMTAEGYGSEKPIADNATDKGRALNRRVELRARY